MSFRICIGCLSISCMSVRICCGSVVWCYSNCSPVCYLYSSLLLCFWAPTHRTNTKIHSSIHYHPYCYWHWHCCCFLCCFDCWYTCLSMCCRYLCNIHAYFLYSYCCIIDVLSPASSLYHPISVSGMLYCSLLVPWPVYSSTSPTT